MTKATAKITTDKLKAAARAAVAKGITAPKHEPASEEGVDSTQVVVVNSGSSIFNPSTQGAIMNDTKTIKAESGATESQAAKEAAAKAKIAEKAAKLEAATRAKEQKAIEAKEKAAAREAAKAERDARAKETAAEREARIAAAKEAGRNYVGSMLALTDRVKQGVYVKGMTGQLRSSDELAITLDAVPPTNVIKLALEALGLETNPYTALNVGQQSMNLRNKMRGAIKSGKLTLETVKEIRDKNNYATAEDATTKKAEAKAVREQKAAEAKALKEKAQAEAAAKKAEAAKIKAAGKPAEAGQQSATA